MTPEQIAFLASQGISFTGGVAPHLMSRDEYKLWGRDIALAMDAQPSLVTAPNNGIPSYLTNVLDPETVDVLVTPMKAAEVYGEEKRGDWTTLTTQFPVAERTGQVSGYGDWNTNGSSGANFNFPSRDSYHVQIVSQWGEREAEIYGLAKINYKAEIDKGSALALGKFQNKSYLFGVATLPNNYGMMNDPNLPAPIVPTTKAAGGTTWAVATALEIYADWLKLFKQLQSQMGGLIDMEAKMTGITSPTAAVYLNTVSQYNVSVRTTLRDNFPNLTLKTIPEFTTQAGELVQLLLDAYEGVKTTFCAFTEKMRAHAVVVGLSGWQQKKSGGTWGSILRRPVAIAQMLGV